MDHRRLERALDGVDVIYAACGLSLAIGLLFIFVWAPHPWGHEGFDHYHQLALTLAAGGAFPTMDVPWGYAYFLAAFYRVFGDHPTIPLLAQATLNAAMPLLVFAAARVWFDRRTAALAAVITSVGSFNTVYASTQSSDAVCTVIFMCAVLAFVTSQRRNDLRWSALAGALAGLESQFRPNLVLIPLLLVAYLALFARRRRWPAHAATLIACTALVLAPWLVRNYRLTRMFVPASVHSGVQLWYGTLQVGPYLHSRAYNPRAIFESPVFEYTSLDHLPLIITARPPTCDIPQPTNVAVVYWTDRDRTPRTAPGHLEGGAMTFSAAVPPAPAVFYYYLTGDWTTPAGLVTQATPTAGAAAPFVFFVSRDHLTDLDLHGDLLDVFDLIRMMRHLAWHEPLPFAARLASIGIDDDGLDAVITRLEREFQPAPGIGAPPRFSFDERVADLTFGDGSRLTVPREWHGRITDVTISGPLASALMWSTEPVERLRLARPSVAAPPPQKADPCQAFDQIVVNAAFYRREPHLLNRYMALAFDNIERAPLQFTAASAYRAVRLFVIHGTDDRLTSQQFSHGGAVYAAGTAASTLLAALLVLGAIIAWRRGNPVGLPLLLILYVPLTISPMLTNMRYTVTVQPIVFIFVAAAVTALLERVGLVSRRHPTRDPAKT
jgi:hypothetical protein